MDKNTPEHFMQLAIQKALAGVRQGQTPFGACIVKDGEVLATAHNQVWKTTDITAHAEIVAIREACRKSNGIDLSGAVIYSTCEPCPMCFSACHWARIQTIVYGASIRDAFKYGFNELKVSNQRLRQLGHSQVGLTGGFMRDACLNVFKTWAAIEGKRVY